MSKPITDTDEIRRLVDGYGAWYHQIEVSPGIVTPGSHDSHDELAQLDLMELPKDLSGRRVLDLGCRDGFFSFEMESRGAEVVAIDYAPETHTGFGTASKILRSNTPYLVRNVYDLDPDEYGLFDVVLFLGLLYHLRNPLAALDRIRSVTKPGGFLFLETQLAKDVTIIDQDAPLWEFHPRDSLRGDATNKWTPNFAGLKAIVEEAEFTLLFCSNRGDSGYIKAQAVNDHRVAHFRMLDASAGSEDAPGNPEAEKSERTE